MSSSMSLPDITSFGFDGSRTNVVMAKSSDKDKGGKNVLDNNSRAHGYLLSRSQVKALAYVFSTADLDGNGYLDHEELKILLTEMGYPTTPDDMASIMEQLGSSADLCIDFRDFKKGAALWAPLTSQVPKKEDAAAPPTQIRKCQSGPEPALVAFLRAFFLEDRCQALRDSGMCLDHVIEASYERQNLVQLCRELGFPKDTMESLHSGLRDICRSRVMVCHPCASPLATTRPRPCRCPAACDRVPAACAGLQRRQETRSKRRAPSSPLRALVG